MGAGSLYILLPVLLGYILVFYHALSISRKTKNNIPILKHSRFLPDWINRRIFFLNAPAQIQYGYDKYNNMPFLVLRPDHDLLVLPARYLAEIRQIPSSRLNLIEAEYNVRRILPRTMQELQHAFDVEVPPCSDGWVSINLYTVILRLVARVASSVVFSDETCRNETWINTMISYSDNLGPTIVFLRPTPDFLRPLVSRLIPSVNRLKQQLRWVQEELIVPAVTARRAAQAANPDGPKPDDFLQWMMDVAANDIDRDPRNIAQSLLIVTAVGMMHTSTMLITHALYDILSHPECFDPLRQEIKDTLPQGWINATVAAFAAQEKLDSVLRESLRLNPPAEEESLDATHRKGEVHLQRWLRYPR
ncbi:conserved hypothetical protein [Aspergillus terreus NIH2624]|uniref:Cytochrome P450 n=1 Tax=Aspergillus terreus (strain NIH 2624 / FGSC A1156) TaxID=341663 RepID=Q0CAJ3_ASPTN|nr:uncharacterized protein ATEG_09291 [Aspergillus terreus NIH2624]EAU30428.1 conserved hypothetical protein [Aspergillus terreus NIH2624]